MSELIRHTSVQEALDAFAADRNHRTFHDVLRRAASGDLLLDISGSTFADPEQPFQGGDTLAIASIVDNAGKRLLCAFTDNDRLTAAVQGPPRSLGQPAIATLEQAIRDHEGIVLDPGHPAQFIAYTNEVQRALGLDTAAAGRLADSLVRQSRPYPEFLADLAASPVYIAVDVQRAPDGTPTGMSVVTARGAGDSAHSAVFTSPAEVWAWSPGSDAHPTRLANVASVALQEGHAGVIVNPLGPSATLSAAELPAFAGGERA